VIELSISSSAITLLPFLAFGEVVSVAKNTAMVTPTLVPGYELHAWEKTPKRIGAARLHKLMELTSPKTKDMDELVREWHDLTDQEHGSARIS
jgi:hypothetical protein